MERTKVCPSERPATSAKSSLRLCSVFTRRFSRTRSKTTMVSWMEKPKTVRMAVTKSVSTCAPVRNPRSAKKPTGMMTSCTSVTSAMNPYIQLEMGCETLRNANAMKSRMHKRTSASAMSALLRSSTPITGPTSVSWSTWAVPP